MSEKYCRLLPKQESVTDFFCGDKSHPQNIEEIVSGKVAF